MICTALESQAAAAAATQEEAQGELSDVRGELRSLKDEVAKYAVPEGLAAAMDQLSQLQRLEMGLQSFLGQRCRYVAASRGQDRN